MYSLLFCLLAAWIHESLVKLSEEFDNLSPNYDKLPRLQELRQWTAEFEKNTREAFATNSRFIDQYFEASDFAYDVLLTKVLLSTLKEHFGRICQAFSRVAAESVNLAPLITNNAEPLRLFVENFGSVVRALRNLMTQSAMRREVGKMDWLPILFNGPIPLFTACLAIGKSAKDEKFLATMSLFTRSVLQFAINFGVSANSNATLTWPLIVPQWILYEIS